MTGAAPWSVKGIDPKAREIAKDLARRSGMTLGDWLNQMIMEDAPADQAAVAAGASEEDRVAQALDRLTSRIETAEHRSTLAISGIDQSVVGLLSRLEGAERQQTSVAARFEGVVEEIKDEQVRVADRLARCEEQAAAPKALESLRSLEAALGKVASQLYDSDGRTRETLTDLKTELDEIAGKVERIDARAPGMVDTALIDGVVSRIVHRLETAEARTSNAIHGLESSFADLDQRLRNTEHKNGGPGPEEKLEQLAADLKRNFDEARKELARRLEESAEDRLGAVERSVQDMGAQVAAAERRHAAGDDRLGAVERSVQEMSEHVAAAERRSAQAIERMGHEVLRMAESLSARMQGVESRNTRAIEQVGGDVARIADTVEQRFRRADQIQAESLERLGGEISRITERLTERIGSSERRAAQAIDDVGEQMSRVTERISERQERASSDIAERIRQSEERTARLLEEARERIDARMAETQRRLAEVTAPAPLARSSEPEDFDLYRDDDLEPGPFGRTAFAAPAEPARAPAAAAPFVEPFHEPDPEPVAAAVAAAVAAPAQVSADDVSPFGPEDDFEMFGPADAAPAPFATAADEDDFDDGFAPRAFASAPEPEPVFDARPGGTREMLEQARAAARAASREEPAAARAAAGGGGGSSIFSGLKIGPRPKQRSGSTLKTALMASATAAALGTAALGYILISAQATGRPERASARDGIKLTAAQQEALGGSTPIAAMAIAPQSMAPGLIEPSAAPVSAEAAGLYASAVHRIEAKDFSGLPDLRRAANLGNPQAQFYLGKLYEGGEAGLHKDLAQARQWTERAAQNGDRKAMHNLALYYFEGTGGPKNATAAAQWFRRASDLGLLDSQYNLARLYEEGFGVGRNTAEAYKWYLIAGRNGDVESRKSADRLRNQLSADARLTAERAAMAFRADIPVAPTIAQAPTMAAPALSGDLVLAQRALSRLGYYRGPQDGVASPALRMAIAAYQKQQGLEATGVVDAPLADRFRSVGG
jgi:localization factor PodJL